MPHIPLSPRCGLGGRDFLRASPPPCSPGPPPPPTGRCSTGPVSHRRKAFPLKMQMFPACRDLPRGVLWAPFPHPLQVARLSPASLGTHWRDAVSAEGLPSLFLLQRHTLVSPQKPYGVSMKTCRTRDFSKLGPEFQFGKMGMFRGGWPRERTPSLGTEHGEVVWTGSLGFSVFCHKHKGLAPRPWGGGLDRKDPPRIQEHPGVLPARTAPTWRVCPLVPHHLWFPNAEGLESARGDIPSDTGGRDLHCSQSVNPGHGK